LAVSGCEQLFSQIMNVDSRTKTRHAHENGQGCNRIAAKEIKLHIENLLKQN